MLFNYPSKWDQTRGCSIQSARAPCSGSGFDRNNFSESGKFVDLRQFLTHGDRKYTEAAFFGGYQLKPYGYQYEYVPSDDLEIGHPFLPEFGGGEAIEDELTNLECKKAVLRIKNYRHHHMLLLNTNMIDINLILKHEKYGHMGLRYISEQHQYCIYPRCTDSQLFQPSGGYLANRL